MIKDRGKSYAQQVWETIAVMLMIAGMFTIVAKFVGLTPMNCR